MLGRDSADWHAEAISTRRWTRQLCREGVGDIIQHWRHKAAELRSRPWNEAAAEQSLAELFMETARQLGPRPARNISLEVLQHVK